LPAPRDATTDCRAASSVLDFIPIG
jgi:hypothetical protein